MLVMLPNGVRIAGLLDVLFIYHRADTDTYHPVIYTENPPPGPVLPYDEVSFVWLKSADYHKDGFSTLQEAVDHVKRLREKLQIDDANVYTVQAIPWDLHKGEPFLIPSWRKAGQQTMFAPDARF